MLAIKQGDFISKPAGKGIAHQFIKDSEEVLEILDCGINDKNDVFEYPDEGVTLEQGKASRKSEVLNNWSSDPNC